jgi:fructuronate reductase
LDIGTDGVLMESAGMTRSVLNASMLGRLPRAVAGPRYDRAQLSVGMAHVGVGAFHRCHQADFTDDLLNERFDRWGVVGINIRAPSLADTLGRQDGLYTRLLREDERIDARVIGCIVSTVDAEVDVTRALAILAAPEIDVVTLTVTEKGYCHKPATGSLNAALPDVAHDLEAPAEPRTLPGILARAMALRMESHGRPLTVVSCDNIPSNGAILENVVGAMAAARGSALSAWIAANVAFPSTMVDRIVPATSKADLDLLERRFGYRDRAAVVGEPFRQWVIEDRFAGRKPGWDLVGASFVADVAPYELIKMRLLNAAQSALAYLGLFAGYEHSGDAVLDPLLAEFVRRMLLGESAPTLPPVPGISPERYIEEVFRRLGNTAIRHRNHQIASDGSQKLVQRFLNPIRERMRHGGSVELLSVVVAAWIVYLASASHRFGRRWTVEDPLAESVAQAAERAGRDGAALTAEIVANDALFDRALSECASFRATLARHIDGLLSERPIGYVATLLQAFPPSGRERGPAAHARQS